MTEIYTWDKIRQWDLVLPPSRPSLYHLNIIADVINSVEKNSPVAVLGCTPEFRDLLFRIGYKEIYIFDKSVDIYSQMTNLRGFSNKEHFIHGDWMQTLPQFSNFFSIILSDLTSGNISYERRSEFYSRIHNSLCKTGLFIDKILTHKGPKKSLKDLKRKYSQLPINLLYVNYFSCEFLFCSELLDKKNLVDTDFFYEYLANDFESPILKKFLTESPKITPYGTIWFYGKDWAIISEYYFRYFTPLKIYEEETGSPFCGNLKIIIGRKAQNAK